MIYDVHGNQLESAYDVHGNQLDSAYDVQGNLIWSARPLNQLKVMSFNVGSWYGYADYVPNDQTSAYYSLHDGIFKRQNADIVGIQEYCSRFGTSSGLTLLQSNYDYVYAVDRQSNPTKAGRAIASKIAVSNTSEVNFVSQNGEVRSYLTSTFQLLGKTIYFINTHLALASATIADQIQELLDYVSDKEYWILTGDFNTIFDSTESSGYAMLIEPFLNEGYNVANAGEFGFMPTFNSSDGTRWSCIDNVMTSSNITITNAYRDETKLTATLTNGIDHLPLITEIEVN